MYGGSIFWSLGWPFAGLGPCAGCHLGRGPEISSAWCCGRSGTPIDNGHLCGVPFETIMCIYILIYIYIIIIYIYLSLPSISLLYSHDINNQPPATYSYGNHHVFYAKPQSYISRGRPYPEASWRKRRWLWPLATTTRSSLWCNWVPLWRLAATRSRASMLFHWKTVII